MIVKNTKDLENYFFILTKDITVIYGRILKKGEKIFPTYIREDKNGYGFYIGHGCPELINENDLIIIKKGTI
jgi:hypothetical protein